MMAMLGSCRTSKQAQDTAMISPVTQTSENGELPTQNRVAQVLSMQGGWLTMQAGGDVQIGGQRSFSSSMQIKMERDKSIFVSLRPFLGIEVGRLVITGDSLFVIDKLHKQYVAEKVSLITGGIPATVSTVQDIFLGRAFLLGSEGDVRSLANKFKISENNGAVVLEPVKQPKEFSYYFNFSPQNKILSTSVKPNSGKAQTYSAQYSDVRTSVAGNVPGSLSISTQVNDAPFTLKIDYGKIRWNESVKTDVKIPTNYKRLPAKRLLGLLGN